MPRCMIATMLALALTGAFCLSAAAQGNARAGEPSCTLNCHGSEAKAFGECIHHGHLGCVDCHGGNAAAVRDEEGSHDPAAGFIGTPSREKIPALCARCHSDPVRMHAFALPTDQLVQYRISNHGKALFERGNTKVAVCTDCHGIHRILPAHDPRSPSMRANLPATCGHCHSDPEVMTPHGLPTDTEERFRRGVHGMKLLVEHSRGAPSCADCHGAHGASPPGVRDMVEVCGHCHVSTGEEYRRSAHHAAEEMRCLACHEEEQDPAYRRSGCTACHQPHAVQASGGWMYHGNEPGRCGHCHREEDESHATTKVILDGRQKLQDAMDETRREILEAKERGLFLEHEHIYLRESERAFVSVQPLIHSLDDRAIKAHLEEGLRRQDRAREQIRKKAQVLRDRQIVLSGLAGILLLLAALLIFKLQAVRRLS